jgi:uncharacterized protein with PQ loop repeat
MADESVLLRWFLNFIQNLFFFIFCLPSFFLFGIFSYLINELLKIKKKTYLINFKNSQLELVIIQFNFTSKLLNFHQELLWHLIYYQ